ncbi:mannose-P-dolichol utilization defect 1 protein [Cylindrobasidium torrendii FP15055 ss-10]|uniref:Mannose-P-dolichol utilization defect 1 protein homolog n=1 Tax=Cylindrobasidium torrendii FP15055 ss-10 TaxID=1314674 RepID=A0A0D7B0E1_9AGAR|nr:mannose-P-dolichol utilization defect 1 protein [Cylindrobasidium torrendii FP15055 ss-10]
MASITKNLPAVIRDLGVSIVGEQCYTSLVENLNFQDVDCLKYSVSKGLGLGVVVGGSIVKVPQIGLIWNARSARGLSLPAYILETLSYAISLTYAMRNDYPFSTYGENAFLTIQNAIITLLITFFGPSPTGKISLISSGFTGTMAALQAVPKETLALLQMATLPLSLSAKLPQIYSNYTSGSTGQLSAFAVVAQILGGMARLFTTSQEVGDPVVFAGFAMALVLNIVLGLQLWAYWGVKERTETAKVRTVELSPTKAVAEKLQAYEPATPERPRTPISRSGTPTPGGKKWARKLD